VPAIGGRYRAAAERTEHRTDIDAGREDRESLCPPRFVLARIELADLGRDVALEEPRAEDQQEQREQEALVERHRQMSGAH
jgi:hypothetical protein